MTRMRVVGETSLALVLGFLGILFAEAWVLAPLSLVLLFSALRHPETTRLRGAFIGFLYGLGTAAAAIWWFWDTLPTDWLGITDPRAGFFAVGATWLLIASAMALPVAAFGAFATILRGMRYELPLAVLLWLIAEEGRAWAFAIVTYDEQSLFGGHFSVAQIGYPLAENSYLLQAASLGGVFALSSIAALAAYALAMLLVRVGSTRTRVAFGGIVLALLFPLAGHLVAPIYGTHEIAVAVANTYVPAGSTAGGAEVRAALEDAYASRADLVVFPEGIGPDRAWKDPEERRVGVSSAFPEKDALLVSGRYGSARADGAHAEVLYESAQRGEIARYEKLFLMPMGEYPPAAARAFFSLLGSEVVNDYVATLDKSISKGDRLVAVPWADTTLGALLCSETISPYLFSTLAQQHDARVLMNLENAAWFHGSPTLYAKMRQIGRIHAVANRAWFVQAGNGSPSFVIDPSGRVAAENTWGDTRTLVVSMRLQEE